jgi:hypothetical protein
VSKNLTTSPRSGDIEVTIGGQKKTVRVSQTALSVYVDEPIPASFDNLAVNGVTGNTFKITTNAPNEEISVIFNSSNPSDASMVTNLNKSRSEQDAANGIYLWTVTFDVTANTSTSPRSGRIYVNVGGYQKIVDVSQVALFVNEPVPASFADLPAGGKTGNVFSITTNSPDEEIEVTTFDYNDPSMITTHTPVRTVQDAANGIYLLTVTFDVTANTTASPRNGYIRVTIGNIQKGVEVSQIAGYISEPDPVSFVDLSAGGKTGNTFTFTTNIPDKEIEVTTLQPTMITNLNKERSVQDAANGIYLWTVTFDVTAHASTYYSRSGRILVTIGGITKTIDVSQVAMYVNNPVPASFADLSAIGKTGNTFTITTNASDEDIEVTSSDDDTSMITSLTKKRETATEDGSFTWTIGFDVTANPTAFNRNGTIEVTVAKQKKTVSVSQLARYVNNPSPSSFSNVIAAGLTGKTFTITTNVPDEDITVIATNTDLTTNLTKKRRYESWIGISTWTIGFDVTANPTTLIRSGEIEVTIGGGTRKVSVSQVAMYVNDPVYVSSTLTNLPVIGETGNTFTVTTNTAIDLTSLTTTDPLMITNLKASRSVQDATNGISVWTVTFDVPANTTTSDREATVSITIGSITKTVRVSQLVRIVSRPTDMHDGLSNCYMVTPGGSVSIPITRAITIGGGMYADIAAVETLWDDNAVINGSPTLSGSGVSRTIAVRASSNQGNAVIALKDAAGTIRWSWHIWVTSYTGNATWRNNGFTFMDRNLGATEAGGSYASCGLLYQWGRKDPFPGIWAGTAGYAERNKFKGLGGGTVNSTGISHSIQEPTTFFSYLSGVSNNWLHPTVTTLWKTSSGLKTVYDPCPSGWRIPAAKSDATYNSPLYNISTGYYAPGNGDVSVVEIAVNGIWPRGGYRNLTGGITSGRAFYRGGGISWSSSESYWENRFRTETIRITPSSKMANSAFSDINHDYRDPTSAGGGSVRCVKE